MPAASCPFTESAYACQAAADRARSWRTETVAIGAVISIENTGTVAALRDLYRTAERIVPALDWLRDFCMFAAIHSDEMQRFRNALQSGKSYDEAERVALTTARLRPVLTVVGQEARA